MIGTTEDAVLVRRENTGALMWSGPVLMLVGISSTPTQAGRRSLCAAASRNFQVPPGYLNPKSGRSSRALRTSEHNLQNDVDFQQARSSSQ
jgi:hypothetical protein